MIDDSMEIKDFFNSILAKKVGCSLLNLLLPTPLSYVPGLIEHSPFFHTFKSGVKPQNEEILDFWDS